MTAVTMRRPLARAWSRVWDGRTRYLVGAVCLIICVVMLTPIVLSVLQSVKSTAEITVGPDTYYFSVLGFSQNGGVTISNVFQTQENAANTSLLYAVVTDQPIGTPEPGTLLLVGSGALAAARRRRKSKV